MKKRLFAGLLTAAMLLAVLPVGAAALESSYTSPNGTTVTVEKLNLPDNTYYMGDGVFYRDEGGVRYLYDKTGAQLGQVSTTDTYFDNFTDGLCRVRMFNIYTAQQGYGFIDKTGQLVIPADYTQINEFSDGYALFMSS
ncbi:MAG TPA: WG repeat-containing protein, partial [Firmicutes bacterium]|nr:WG repeat-containing protein [Bacillota bacterium]